MLQDTGPRDPLGLVQQLDGLVPPVLADAEQTELQQGVRDQVVVVPDPLLTGKKGG